MEIQQLTYVLTKVQKKEKEPFIQNGILFTNKAKSYLNLIDKSNFSIEDNNMLNELIDKLVKFLYFAPNDIKESLYISSHISNIVPPLSMAETFAIFNIDPNVHDKINFSSSSVINTIYLIKNFFFDMIIARLEKISSMIQQNTFYISPNDIAHESAIFQASINTPYQCPVELSRRKYDCIDGIVAIRIAITYSIMEELQEYIQFIETKNCQLLQGTSVNNIHNEIVCSFLKQHKFCYDNISNRDPYRQYISLSGFNFLYKEILVPNPSMDVNISSTAKIDTLLLNADGIMTDTTTGIDDSHDFLLKDKNSWYIDEQHEYEMFIDAIHEHYESFRPYNFSSNSLHQTIIQCINNLGLCRNCARQFLDHLYLQYGINVFLLLSLQNIQVTSIVDDETKNLYYPDNFTNQSHSFINPSLTDGLLIYGTTGENKHLLCEKTYTNPLVLSIMLSLRNLIPDYNCIEPGKSLEQSTLYKLFTLLNTMYLKTPTTMNNKELFFSSKIDKNQSYHPYLILEGKDTLTSIQYYNTYRTDVFNATDQIDIQYSILRNLFQICFDDKFPYEFIGYQGTIIDEALTYKITESLSNLVIRLLEICANRNRETFMDKEIINYYLDLKHIAE